MKMAEEENTKKYFLWIVLFCEVFVLAAVAFFAIFLQLYEKYSDLGTIGDYFGGLLNPVFAFISICAILWTIRLQTKEMAETREELRRAAEAHEQNLNLLRQKEKIERTQSVIEIYFDFEKRLYLSELIIQLEYVVANKGIVAEIELNTKNYCEIFRGFISIGDIIARSYGLTDLPEKRVFYFNQSMRELCDFSDNIYLLLGTDSIDKNMYSRFLVKKICRANDAIQGYFQIRKLLITNIDEDACSDPEFMKQIREFEKCTKYYEDNYLAKINNLAEITENLLHKEVND